MILEALEVSPEQLQARTGWELKPEGMCKGGRCVPMPDDLGERIDAHVLADRLGMALVHDETHGLYALGPESEGRALISARLPEITLPDRDGNPFSLQSLLGSKVLLIAWASW